MFRKTGFFAVVVLVALMAAPSVFGQVESGPRPRAKVPQARITQAIDETNRVTLRGNTRPEAVLANDRGPVATLWAGQSYGVTVQVALQRGRLPFVVLTDRSPAGLIHHRGCPRWGRS